MVLFSIGSAYGLSAGILLWAKTRGAVTYAKVFLVIQPYMMFGLWKVYSAADPSGASEAGAAIFWAIIGFLIWFPYLTFSKRVKATYGLNEPNKRSPLLAFVMGAALGPLGTIYFNIRVLLMSVLASILAIVIADLLLLLLGFSLPPWMRWIWLAYFPIANSILAFQWNDALDYPEPDDSAWTTAIGFGAGLGRWAFRVIGITATVYGAIELFAQHRILAGIFALIFLPFALSWLAGWIIKAIAFIVVLIFGVINARKEAKS